MKSAQILIIDKVGLIGEPLYLKLSKEFLVIFVSKKPGAQVPFSKKFPIIPDNKYSHIIAIKDEASDLEFLHTIIKKAKDVNSDFIFVEELSAKNEYHIGKVLSEYSSAKVVLYGDIFDNKLIYKHENFKSVINKFVYQAQKFGSMQVVGDGLREAYPVFINDVVDCLIDLIFGINDRHSLFYIFPKHPPTELSLAHMIQRANPQISIDFIKHDPRREIISYPPNGKYLLDAKYPLAKKIRSIDIQNNPPKEAENEGKTNSYNKKTKRFHLFIIWILIFLIFSPLFSTLLFSFLGLNTLYFAKKEIDKGDFVNVKSSLHLSEAFFYAGKKTSEVLIYQAKIVGYDRNLKRFSEDIDSGHKISQGLLQAFNAESYLTKVIAGKSKSPVADFTKGQSDLKSAIVILEKLAAEGKMPREFSQKLNSIDPLIKLVSNTSDVLPNIFGLDVQKTYLVLFQNNMELRPGGGFIGSYGILKINMGEIEDFSTHDVYDADVQLRGHVEPPFAIRRHLPSAHWYLRDSNFDVDFVKSASSSSNFLDIETGQKANGVIGVDVSFIKNVLHAIGSINVTDYKEKVDENNLYKLTATQKKDFLRSLYRAMQAKISQGNIPYLPLMQAVSDSISQKHLLFAFRDNIQNIFTVNGWSSSLWDDRKENKNSINDFLGINEANLGVNKANYFIKRQVSQKVTIRTDGNISEELTINYKNAITSWPGGDYKNYLRIILPLSARLSSISINDISQSIVDAVTDFQIYEAKNFKAPAGLEVEKTSEENKTIYGFIIRVPVGEVVKVKIQYDFAKKAALDQNAFSYNLRLFKQPGIDSIPYSFSLSYPNSFNIINTTDEISKGEGKVTYSEKIVEDKDLIVNFARK